MLSDKKVTVVLLYLSPWYSDSYNIKDVVQFPSTLAKIMKAKFVSLTPRFIFGKESDEVSKLLRLFGFIMNLITFIVFPFKLDKSRQYIFVLFNINIFTGFTCWVLKKLYTNNIRVFVKSDYSLELDRMTRGKMKFRRKLAFKLIGTFSDVVICETPESKLCLTRYLKPFSSKTVFCMNGLVPNVDNEPQNRSIDILIVSRFNVSRKGVERYRGMIEFLAENEKYTVYLVGTGASAFKNSLSHNVVGSLNIIVHETLPHIQLLNIMTRTKLLVNCSIHESFCISLVEALHYGCNFLSTPVGIAPYLSKQTQKAVVANWALKDFSETISKLLKDDNITENTHYDWHHVVVTSDLAKLLQSRSL